MTLSKNAAKKSARKSATKSVKPVVGSLLTLKKQPTEKIAAQVQVFLATLKKLGGKNVDTEKMLAAAKRSLKTKQEPAAVWQHYRRGLIKAGVIVVAKMEKPTPNISNLGYPVRGK